MTLRYDCGEVITAMVTPMDKTGAIDYDKVEALTKHLISTGSDTLLVAGTSGESPTLTNEEEIELVSTVKRAAANKAKIILGAGSKSTTLPIILYNIPSRTGVMMEPKTVAYLASTFDNIVGVKQSCPDMDKVTEMRILCPDDFSIYSGDDSLTLPMLSLGVRGVISVASHLFGSEIKSMIRNFKTGEVVAARNMHKKLYPVFRALFMAPNPTPVKAALAYKGIVDEYVRKPLVTLTEDEKIELFRKN